MQSEHSSGFRLFFALLKAISHSVDIVNIGRKSKTNKNQEANASYLLDCGYSRRWKACVRIVTMEGGRNSLYVGQNGDPR